MGLNMPVINNFKTCPPEHRPEGAKPLLDWRECSRCVDEVAMQLTIARSYLTELANADGFNDNGDCVKPIAEPVQGRHFAQIASTGLGACSDI